MPGIWMSMMTRSGVELADPLERLVAVAGLADHLDALDVGEEGAAADRARAARRPPAIRALTTPQALGCRRQLSVTRARKSIRAMHFRDADGGDEAVACGAGDQRGALAEHRLEPVADIVEADAGARERRAARRPSSLGEAVGDGDRRARRPRPLASISISTGARERATPCLTAFSTSGWTRKLGTRAEQASGAQSTAMSSRSPKRTLSMSRYSSVSASSSSSGMSSVRIGVERGAQEARQLVGHRLGVLVAAG